MIEIERTVEDFITYMANYLSDARIALNDGNTVAALDAVRKITALGVACMEQNGVTTRPAEMTVRARKKSVG